MKPTQPQNVEPDRGQVILQGFALVAMVFLAYLPALRGAFIWDDDVNVTENPSLRSLHGLSQIWFKPGATQQYYPLTHTGFWLDYHLWGANPLPYHLENILLHSLSAVLLWRILKGLAAPGAWFGAALFGVHPVCAESVAWISERKNAVCGVFFLAALFAAARFWLPLQKVTHPGGRSSPSAPPPLERGPWKFYWLSLVLYLCALWGKTAGVGMPAVIAVLLWWKRGKITRRDGMLLAPFFAVGMAVALVTINVETKLGATGPDFQSSFAERCLIAARAVWFYLGKIIWPHPLIFMYPRWKIQVTEPLAYLPVVAILAGLGLLWQRRKSWGRPMLVGAFYFFAMLFPVAGFFNQTFFGFSFVADHFQYLACMGPLALAGAGLSKVTLLRAKRRFFAKAPLYGALLLGLGVLTWRQCDIYTSQLTLWQSVVAKNPESWMGHRNLGLALSDAGREDEAVKEFNAYNQILQVKPASAEAHYNLGNAMTREGNLDAAIQEYRQALQINPDYADANINLGNVQAREGNLAAAIQNYTMALQIKPENAIAHYGLGVALAKQQKVAEAIEQYRLALKTDPNFANAHCKLGEALKIQGNYQEAREHLTRALQIRPDYAEAERELQTFPP